VSGEDRCELGGMHTAHCVVHDGDNVQDQDVDGGVEVVGQAWGATFKYWGETLKFGKLQLSVTNDAFNLAPALESSRRRT
jgi:hypothetical protein